ncbi:WecB/TagA/CpsF family glycosyltransferase [Arthrobacter sp. efr-133-TYG-104]|uniref:WecB/TagA/CpsF family glycosyltransferase n=1 Tax=Arthrobacter sp. efr-133-TYG-104 TaxID=3040324 RepID=UPI0025503672|nr:WecB/TagA/CpsF family glycosyltransferase [Arthrobacter sp. efr-133-TYG-104]
MMRTPQLMEQPSEVNLGGAAVKLLAMDTAVHEITNRAATPASRPLGVCSANLDHIRHFGAGSRWLGTLDASEPVEWLTLIDGAPLAAQARRLTGRQWPRLAGSDLVGPLLDEAAMLGLSVGFLGGSTSTHQRIKSQFAAERPNLRIAGWWSPDRPVLGNESASRSLAAEIAETAPDILVVGLGKPRQELWIAEYGHLTGARVLLAFGAVVDFLAGQIRRAPAWMSSNSLEWAWRLMLEPRRLARRYLVDGPESYLKLRRSSSVPAPDPAGQPSAGQPGAGNIEARPAAPSAPAQEQEQADQPRARTRFVSPAEKADVAVVIVTYNNASDVGPLVLSLREETREQTIKVVVADNSPDQRTLDELAKYPDVIAVSTGGNLGYAGGINVALSAAGEAESYLVLNPDLRVAAGALRAMRRRLADTGAGVVVPVLLDNDGSIYPSLRREPGVLRALGDAVWGSHWKERPEWLAEMDWEPESYLHGHRVQWATGAALLISAEAAAAVGAWDERFFLYSEETDFCRRVRESGFGIWFEPAARMWHERGGSGSSPGLVALMAVNRVRYAAKYMGRGRRLAFGAAVLAAEVARVDKPGHREAALAVMSRRRRSGLPMATGTGA